jgi:hypothetical protein
MGGDKSKKIVRGKKPPASKMRRPYDKPTVAKLTHEQAKLKLLGAAIMGDEGAKDLLGLVFAEVPKKKSA